MATRKPRTGTTRLGTARGPRDGTGTGPKNGTGPRCNPKK